jgi:outer membrane usher protein
LLGTAAVVRLGLANATTTGPEPAVSLVSPSSPVSPSSGARLLAGVERSARGGSMSAQWDRFDEGYRPLAAMEGESRPRERFQAAAGAPFGPGQRLSVGITVAHQSAWDRPSFALAGLHLAAPLAQRMHVIGHASREWSVLDRWQAGVSLLVPMGRHGSASASTTRGSDGSLVPAFQAWQAPDDPSGWAWRARASGGPAPRLQPGVSRTGPLGEVLLDASLGADEHLALRAGASGAVGLVAGAGVFATRRIGNEALAVVRVGELEGVPIEHAHRAAAMTRRNGVAVVPGLLPYQSNRLAIDAQALPLEMGAARLAIDAVPHARAAVVVDFGLRSLQDMLVTLQAPDGQPIPEGAQARVLPDGAVQRVARRGEAYLPDVPPSGRIAVVWTDGACEAAYEIGPDAGAMPVVGPIDCVALR